MLDGELVVRTDHGAVEEAPNGFDGVGMNLSAYPFVGVVVDVLVLGVGVPDAPVGAQRVGVDRFGVRAYNVAQEAVEQP